MAKRSNLPRTGKPAIEKKDYPPLDYLKMREELVEDFEVLPEPETVKLVLLKDITLKYVGPVTGQEYIFGGAGSIVNVDKRDVDIMLQEKGGKGCCPASVGPTPYFEIIE